MDLALSIISNQLKKLLDTENYDFSSTGEQLKVSLGLEEYQYVYICRVLNVTFPIYIVYYNSRFTGTSISPQKIKKLKAFQFFKIKDNNPFFEGKAVKLSLPYNLDSFNEIINKNSLMLVVDTASDMFIK